MLPELRLMRTATKGEQTPILKPTATVKAYVLGRGLRWNLAVGTLQQRRIFAM